MWWIWLRTLFFASTFVAFALVLVPRWILGSEHQVASGSLRVLAVLLLALGFALMVWCWSEFARRGRGTPAPFDPPRQLVIAGPYRYVRNPMYVAGMLVILGQAALYGSMALVGYAVVFLAATFAFVVGYEEQTLARRFGSEYGAYKSAVRRWIPRLHPYVR